MHLDGAVRGAGVQGPRGLVDARDQRGVSHVKLRHGPEDAGAHREGVQHAPVVPRPHLTAAVAHGQQIGAQLELLKRFSCPAVIYGHRVIFAAGNDVVVIRRQTQHSVTMETEALH